MQLELAIVQSCNETGCRVRPLGQDETLEVRYSAAVQDRIHIRRGELVAIDHATDIPLLVWRWRRGRVLKALGAQPAPGYVLIGAGPTAAEARVARPDLQLEPGDHVWVLHSARGVEVFDRSVNGEPEHAEWIRREYFPFIEAQYAAHDAA